MDELLYDLCDWAGIEGIIYDDYRTPHDILGAHITDDGVLFNMFAPGAESVILKIKGKKKQYDMEMVDEEGFFAVLLPMSKIPSYSYQVTFEDGKVEEIDDIYRYRDLVDEAELNKFDNGICYKAYDLLGSHVKEVDGVKGTLFTVWAPNALAINVVGSFNDWNGKGYMMSAIGDTGVFYLFVPGAKEGDSYKYEMKFKGDVTAYKADPYARQSEVMPSDASIICSDEEYKWTDEKWIARRKSVNSDEAPVSIYELHLGNWRRPAEEDKEYYTYKEIAPILAKHVKELGYTHIQLMPIMEYRDDSSMGFNTTGYYAPTSRYGSKDDFAYFVNYMHSKNIGVILEWVPAYFADDKNSLVDFDGSYLYDHMNPKKGIHPVFGTRMFNNGRKQVSNFLIANALYWLDIYHIDGIKFNDISCMLHLDYGRNYGEWEPNMYGESDNLESVEFFKHLNSIHAKRNDGTMLIAEDYSAWRQITDKVEDDGLGFDLKLNNEWAKDIMEYMQCDPLFRKGRHNKLTISMLYNYSAKYIIELSHNVIADQKASILSKLPGEYSQRMSNLRALFAYIMTHPGKKLFFMGQELAQESFMGNNPIDWNVLNYDNHKNFYNYIKKLNDFYTSHPALYAKDYETDGFEWINDMDAERSILTFIRKSDKQEETLVVVCNFTPVVYENYSVGVPYKGRYKEMFNSDYSEFGGSGVTNPRLKNARPGDVDGRPFYINVTVPPMGVSVYNFTPLAPAKITSISEDEEKTASKGTKTAKGSKTSKVSKTAKASKVTKSKKDTKASSADKSAKIDKETKTSSADKSAKIDKGTKTSSADKSAKIDKGTKTSSADKSAKIDKGTKTSSADKSAKIDKETKNSSIDKSVEADKETKTSNVAKSVKTEKETKVMKLTDTTKEEKDTKIAKKTNKVKKSGSISKEEKTNTKEVLKSDAHIDNIKLEKSDKTTVSNTTATKEVQGLDKSSIETDSTTGSEGVKKNSTK